VRKKALNRWVFDAGADVYAWLSWQPVWREHCASLADHFPKLDRPIDVLDLGIGPGISGVGILDRRPDARVVGLDLAGRMLKQAQRRVRRVGCRVPLVQADATSLPFPDDSFDVVTGHSFLYLVPDRERVVAEAARVLRPGGRAVFLEPAARTGLGWLGLRGPLRFLLSMVLWRAFSRGMGRFEPDALTRLLSRDLREVRVEPTLAGLGLLGIAVFAPDAAVGI